MYCAAPLRPPGSGATSGGESSYTPPHLVQEVLGQPGVVDGERKQVAVLLCDVVESLQMAHDLDPEDVHAIMDGFFAIALESVHRHGGTINQFRGDGFMALFGAPRTRARQSLRALHAALEIRDRLVPYAASVEKARSIPLLVRTGIHAGEVWVGSIGSGLRMDYTAEGATVGLAARLESDAAAGQILVSAKLAREAEGLFEMRSLGVRHQRGVPAGVEVFELLGPGAFEEAFEVEMSSSGSALRGRADEIDAIQRLRGSVAYGSSLLVSLEGPAGIGKSRLAAEIRRIDGASSSPRWLTARSREPDRTRAWSTWQDLLKRWPPPVAGAEEARAYADRIASGHEIDADTVEALIRRLLASWDAPGAVQLFFEDLHWIDPSSRRLLDSLMLRPPSAGVFVLATVRDDLAFVRPSQIPHRRVEVGALATQYTREIASEILGAGDDALASFAAIRSGGNPLFAQELARSLREGADSLRQSARVELTWLMTRPRVPQTIDGVIGARVDALPERAKRTLQVASVVGEPFDAALIEELDPALEGEAAAALALLEDRRLVAQDGGRFEFRHALICEVVCDQMLRPDLRGLHERLGLKLEAAHEPGPAAASRAGTHLALAGLDLRAAPHLARAGTAYLTQLAVPEAEAHLSRAWGILRAHGRDSELLTQVGLALASALNSLDRARDAAVVLSALDPASSRTRDRGQLAEACSNQGWILFSEQNRLEDGRRLLERAVELTESVDNGKAVLARSLGFLVRVYHLDAEIDRAVACARRCHDLALAAGNRFGVVFSTGNEGFVRCERGEVECGLSLCRDAFDAARDLGNSVATALTAAWLARALLYRGDPESALRLAHLGCEEAERVGQAGARYTSEGVAVEARLLIGDPRGAEECFERLAKIGPNWPQTAVLRATSRLERGDYEAAADIAERSLAVSPPRLPRIRLLRVFGLASGLNRSADVGRAQRALRDAAALAEECDLRPLLAMCHVSHAELLIHGNEPEQAEWYLERAVAGFRSCAMDLHARLAQQQRKVPDEAPS